MIVQTISTPIGPVNKVPGRRLEVIDKYSMGILNRLSVLLKVNPPGSSIARKANAFPFLSNCCREDNINVHLPYQVRTLIL